MEYDAHDSAVAKQINHFILLVNAKYSDESVARKLEIAWALNHDARHVQGSTNTVGRDVDYYFAARKEVGASDGTAAKMAKAALGNAAFCVYAIGKIGSAALGHPEWTRTDPNEPNAPVGGIGWMNLGSVDGMSDLGSEVAPLLPHSQGGNRATVYSPIKRGML